ncbi:MAG: DNA-directed RNA polymerase subunit omega [Fibrobacteraceae bacterium]
MSDQRVFLDDIYASEKCGGSIFRAVVMMAHEARFINEQARLGYLQLTKKPTTIAMYKFKENKLTMQETPVVEQAPVVDDDSVDILDSAFGD